MPSRSTSTAWQASAGVLRLTGRLDTTVAADLRLVLAAAVDGGVGDLEVHLAGVTGVDASGLAVLLGAHRRAGRLGRRLVLVDVPPVVGRVLLITRFDRVLALGHGESAG